MSRLFIALKLRSRCYRAIVVARLPFSFSMSRYPRNIG
ncbi:hypothetical protein D083_3475 [Dickeya solani RNS 08.23.3.1.A]|nr:hypothetical protein D083_3475 [Dickeya solani RNS 08.23.3.1.A]